MRYYQVDPQTNVIVADATWPSVGYVALADNDPRVVAYLNPPPSSADVDAERDRRINLGFTFQTVAYQTRLDKDDFTNISGMGALAIEALRDGTGTATNLRWFDPNSDFKWIAADNSQVSMDAPTMVAFGKAAAIHKAAHRLRAAAIKAMNPIPADYTNAVYWPAP